MPRIGTLAKYCFQSTQNVEVDSGEPGYCVPLTAERACRKHGSAKNRNLSSKDQRRY